MMTNMPTMSGRKAIATAVVVFIICFSFLAGGIAVNQTGEIPPFDIDEAHKLGETYFWHLFAENRDFGNPTWNDDFYARTNPPVGKYIFGAALAAAGFHTTDLRLQQDFERLWRDDKELRRVVPDTMLHISRITSAFFGALAAACLFIISYRAAGRLAGVLAPLLFFAHPQMWHITSLGLYDSICLAFVLLLVVVSCSSGSALAAFLAGKAGLGRLLVWTVAIPALFIALALGTKMNSFVVLPYYGLFLLVVGYCSDPFRNRFKGVIIASRSFLLTVLLSLAFLIAINPHYYTSPFAKFLEMMRLSHDWTVKQQLDPGGGLFSLAEKSTAVGLFTLESSSLPLPALLGTPGCWLGIFCFLLGLTCLFLRGAYFHRPMSADSGETAGERWYVESVLTWIAVAIVGTSLWLPLEWTRYFMIPYAAVAVATAIGIQALLLLGYRLFRRVGKLAAGDLSFADVIGRAKEEFSPPMGRVRAGACVISLVLWSLLSFTHLMIDPEMISQGFAGMSPVSAASYGNSNRPLPSGNFSAHYQRGLYFLQHNEYAAATEHLERSLELSMTTPNEAASSIVQRSLVLDKLALLYAGLGDRERTVSCLRRYILDVGKLQDSMWTSDQKIKAAYDRLVAEKAAGLALLWAGGH